MFFKRLPACKRRTVSDSEKIPERVNNDWFNPLTENNSDETDDKKDDSKDIKKNIKTGAKVKMQHAKSCEHINARA